MDYCGGNEDRQQRDEIRAAYLETMTRFVLWLVENNRPVRLFTSDSADAPVVAQILASVRARHPDVTGSQVVAEPVTSMAELLRQTACVGTAVATRYHNVLFALLFSRPTLSIGYAAKHDELMAEMGMARYCQPARSLDLERLIEQFAELESGAAELRSVINEHKAAKVRLVERQLEAVSDALFPDSYRRRGASRLAPVP